MARKTFIKEEKAEELYKLASSIAKQSLAVGIDLKSIDSMFDYSDSLVFIAKYKNNLSDIEANILASYVLAFHEAMTYGAMRSDDILKMK